jgi:hypothetical protein
MSAVETPARAQARPHDEVQRPPQSPTPRLGSERTRWGLAVGAVVLVAFLLRIWGVRHGLPYAYNTDENAHFVTRAIGLFGHDWDPQYYVNPPAYTYLAHILFAVWYGGREGVSDQFASDPTEVWVLARVLSAVLSTIAVWLLYLAGARLLDRRAGLLAAGILAVSFLPVFYSHLALNDAPTLAPVCLALWGIAGVLRFGRARDYAWAGIGLGLACATKYTGGIVLLPLLAAAGAQWAAGGRHSAVRGLAIGGGLALLAFVVANPYALLDFNAFWEGVRHQSDASGDAAGKLGLTQDSGVLYYLWSFGWGMGYIPLALAVGGAVRLWYDERRLWWLLVPALVIFIVFMGTQQRYFGRWLMPILPIVALLAAYAALELVDLGARLRPALRPTLLALAVILTCGQGLVYSLHNGDVLAREDTRNLTREWMTQNIPLGAKIVVEPVVPDLWAQDIGHPSPVTGNGNRWVKYPVTRSQIDPRTGRRVAGEGVVVNIEDFERVLRPELVDLYEQQGYCWVITGSTQRGRAEADPQEVPQAIAYYDELERRGTKAYEASPYKRGEGPVEFNFDWSFDYYPRAYHRPGPVMTVYRLRGGRCGR